MPRSELMKKSIWKPEYLFQDGYDDLSMPYQHSKYIPWHSHDRISGKQQPSQFEEPGLTLRVSRTIKSISSQIRGINGVTQQWSDQPVLSHAHTRAEMSIEMFISQRSHEGQRHIVTPVMICLYFEILRNRSSKAWPATEGAVQHIAAECWKVSCYIRVIQSCRLQVCMAHKKIAWSR